MCSVPQGSVLGPRLLALYTVDLEEINFHSYAGDSQLYVHCQRRDTVTASILLHALNTASTTSAIGWQQIVYR